MTSGARRASAQTFASRRSAPAPTSRPSCNTSASLRSTSASAARTAAAPTIPSTTRSTTTCASLTRRSTTASLARLRESTKNYQTAFSSPAAQERLRSRETQVRLDQILMGVERSMTRDAGLPRRPWFKHQIYAPGFYTGYGVKTLPGVREAVEQHNWKEAEEQVTVVAGAIERAAAEIDRAAALLQGGGR